ncbi:MAG TPA: phospho-sugar mutase, partial [Candidatus Nanopelagicales bacterium]|nr:phospho-sugar mutase [Candidatus Nanopelagicales bacterium]
EDPDPDTRAELERLLDAEDLDGIADRFSGRLEFGTAGLRGEIGAGPNRMNRVVVTRAAAGLCSYLAARGGKAVVIGYDARHKSDVFARDTAEVVSGAGMSATVLPRPLPTPVLAFAIRHLGADAGVMVTASHNPPQDNGYKVYLGDGSQIVPPADAEISAAIEAVGLLATVPRGDDWETLRDDVLDAYLDRVAGLVDTASPRDLDIVYTPLHGVGRDVVLAAFDRAGFRAPTVVSRQGDPDPEFSTVAFPNPEEPGAIDLALAAAVEHDADIVLANDPDADRCAVAVPAGDDGWRMLRGDEVGALLATHLVRRDPALSGTFAASIVSSSLLGRIAAAHGLGYAETLTGFKWISRVDGLRYGYEEALGYCVDPAHVGDKDGVSATLLVVELVAALKAAGRTVHDQLDDLAVRYGLHATDQLAVRVEDVAVIDAAMARLRADPPTALAGLAVQQFEDLETGSAQLPPTDGLRLRLEHDTRVIVRPSGTEPKIKCYLEVVVPVEGGDVAAARSTAALRLTALRADIAAAAGLPAPG